VAEVHLWGESFHLVDEPSEFAFLEFAEASEDIDSSKLAALAAVMRLLRETIADQDWARFRASARKNKAKIEDLLPVLVSVFIGGDVRPTGRPSGSSDGSEATGASSEDGVSSEALSLLGGRPDLQRIVHLASVSRTA